MRICFHIAYKLCHEEKLLTNTGIYEIITNSTDVEWQPVRHQKMYETRRGIYFTQEQKLKPKPQFISMTEIPAKRRIKWLYFHMWRVVVKALIKAFADN